VSQPHTRWIGASRDKKQCSYDKEKENLFRNANETGILLKNDSNMKRN